LYDAIDSVGDEGEPHQADGAHEDEDGEDLQRVHSVESDY